MHPGEWPPGELSLENCPHPKSNLNLKLNQSLIFSGVLQKRYNRLKTVILGILGLANVRRCGDEDENPVNIIDQKQSKKYMRTVFFSVLCIDLRKKLVND